VHFRPIGASRSTFVERWFALLTQKQLRRGVHRSTRALEAAILEFMPLGNMQPKPLVWTKTADEILASGHAFACGSRTHEDSQPAPSHGGCTRRMAVPRHNLPHSDTGRSRSRCHSAHERPPRGSSEPARVSGMLG